MVKVPPQTATILIFIPATFSVKEIPNWGFWKGFPSEMFADKPITSVARINPATITVKRFNIFSLLR